MGPLTALDTDPLRAASAGRGGQGAVVQLQALRAPTLGSRVDSGVKGRVCYLSVGQVTARGREGLVGIWAAAYCPPWHPAAPQARV